MQRDEELEQKAINIMGMIVVKAHKLELLYNETNLNFILSQEQEEELVEYACKRLEELKVDNKERIEVDRGGWNVYNNQREDREVHDSIYSNSNVPIPLTSLVVDHISQLELRMRSPEPLLILNSYLRELVMFSPAKCTTNISIRKLEKMGRTRERLGRSLPSDVYSTRCNFKSHIRSKKLHLDGS